MKKSEKIEVRIAPEIKRQFLARCRAAGMSASDTLRELILHDVAQPSIRSASPAVRAVSRCVGGIALLFGLICLGATGLVAAQAHVRLGLVVYMLSQGLLSMAIGLCMFRTAWRAAFVSLGGSGVLAVVYASEVNPPASLWGAITGVLIGGAGPCLTLALALALAGWIEIARRRENRQRVNGA